MLTHTAYPPASTPPQPLVRLRSVEVLNDHELPTHVIAYMHGRTKRLGSGAFGLIDNRNHFVSLSQTTSGLLMSAPNPDFRIPRGSAARRPKFPVKLRGSTSSSFERFRECAIRRGFNYVATLGGPVKIADWHPWGLFHGADSDHEPCYGGLRWYWPNLARDRPVTRRWLALGVWTFLVDPPDEICLPVGISRASHSKSVTDDPHRSTAVSG